MAPYVRRLSLPYKLGHQEGAIFQHVGILKLCQCLVSYYAGNPRSLSRGKYSAWGMAPQEDEMAENGQVPHDFQDSEDDIVEDEIPGSLVFQCNTCNTILGDTMAWVDGNTEMGTFTIHRTSDDVELGTSIKASQEGMDEGSTYKDVKCSCKAKVGRYYLATTSAVDHLRKMYTLYASSIKMYKLNSGRQHFEDVRMTAGGLPLLSQHELTDHVRKVQGIILQICNQLGLCSKPLGIPMPPALIVAVDPALLSNQDVSPPAKVKINKEEDTQPFSRNHYDIYSDEELSYSHNTKPFEKNSSAEGRRVKRERSESDGTAQSSSASERRIKKSKQ